MTPIRPACRAVFLFVFLAAAAAPTRAHDGAKFEPADGKLLHGVGQCDAVDKYLATAGQYVSG